MSRRARRLMVWVFALTLVAATLANAAPEGQLTMAVHFTPAPTLFEPAETPGLVSPFMFLYVLHDALVKPMPGQSMAPSLAESWSTSPDGLVYEFVLRKGVRFHNGEPVTADDVKFSFERYRGISAQMLKERVAAIETPDARHIRFRLTQPWPRQQQALVRPPQAPPQNVSLQAVASSACTLLR
jgi:peptide/nickel transport system substrate-binding protein